MIARASGAYASLPVPNLSAIGIKPKTVASDVIRIGRKTDPARIHHRINQRHAVVFDAMRELDDEDAVRDDHADHHHDAHQRLAR